MDDLVRWLRACLDEDQRIAEAARGQGEGRWHHETGYHTGRVEDERGETVVYDEGAPLDEEAEHIAAHDPARALREIDAKRRIVDRYAWLREHGDTGGTAWVLPLLALPYADRPGFQESWRP